MKRLAGGIVGGSLALATLVGASSLSEDHAVAFLLSAGGVACGLFVFWLAHGRHGNPWHWYHSVGVAIAGSLIVLVVAVALLNPGDSGAMGFAVGSGISYGLILGVCAALLVYSFDLSASEKFTPTDTRNE